MGADEYDNVERRVLEEERVGERKIVLETTGRLALRRRIGLWSAVAFVTGSVIGSGIFISPKGALSGSGSVGLSLVIWAFCGVMSMILGLVYAELGGLVPKSGGDYTYIRESVGAVPAFLVSWTQCTISNSGSRSVLALVFADYVCAPIFGQCKAPDSIRKSIAAVELLLLAITNTLSVNFVASMQGLFTALKVGALVVITIGGFLYLGQGRVQNFEDAFSGSSTDVTSITLAIYSCMWAYGGFNNLNEIAEELIAPKKDIPRAIIISMTLVTIIYLTTNVSYFTLLSKSDFLSVPAVAFSWGEIVLGSAAILIPISVMCSVHGASNGGMFTDVRVRFAASRAGHLPEVLSYLHQRTHIPVAALVYNTSISLLLLIPADIKELINIVGFMGFLTQALTVIALLRLRYHNRNLPTDKNQFQTPLVVPVVALLLCIFMVVAPFVKDPRLEFVYGAAFVASGILFYLPFVYLNLTMPGWNTLTMYVQLFMEICPTVPEKCLEIS